jgi:chromosome partitioning protein
MTMIIYNWLPFTWPTYFECIDSSWLSNNPIQCEYFALEGLGKLLNTIKSIQKITTDLDIEGLLLTMFDSDCDYRIKLLKRYKSILTIWFFDTIIQRNA